MKDAHAALASLRAGNARFVAGAGRHVVGHGVNTLDGLQNEQHPFAVILGCSDSRAPAEILFDQGVGDLFVVRVAGNVAAPSQVGSIEYATSHLGPRLVVVLGHSCCGAIGAAIEHLDDPRAVPLAGSTHLGDLVDMIMPHVRESARDGSRPQDRLARAVRANVQGTVDYLRTCSPLLTRLIREEGLLIVGAEYSITTGAVHFYDDVPATSTVLR